MQDREITVQVAVIERWVNDDPVDIVYHTAAVGKSRTDADTPSVHLVTNCAVSSGKDSPVVKDGTTAGLEVGVEVHRVQKRDN